MSCQRIIRMLSSFQDGELDPARRREVELHLRECPACRAEWDGLQELASRLLQVPPPASDPFFPARVMAGLERAPRRKSRLLPATVYATIFLMTFLAGFLLRTSAGGQAAQPAAASTTFSAVLLEPQGLGLMAVHEDTLSMFDGSRP